MCFLVTKDFSKSKIYILVCLLGLTLYFCIVFCTIYINTYLYMVVCMYVFTLEIFNLRDAKFANMWEMKIILFTKFMFVLTSSDNNSVTWITLLIYIINSVKNQYNEKFNNNWVVGSYKARGVNTYKSTWAPIRLFIANNIIDFALILRITLK